MDRRIILKDFHKNENQYQKERPYGLSGGATSKDLQRHIVVVSVIVVVNDTSAQANVSMSRRTSRR